jgi:hypothetical protein
MYKKTVTFILFSVMSLVAMEEANDHCPRPFGFLRSSLRSATPDAAATTSLDVELAKEDLSAEGIAKTDEEIEEIEMIHSISNHAMEIFLDQPFDEKMKGMTFSKDLMKTIMQRLGDKKERRKSLVRLFGSVYPSPSSTPDLEGKKEDRGEAHAVISSPVNDILDLRRELKELVISSLEESFLAKEDDMRSQREEIVRAKSKVQIAAIGAITTVCTTITATFLTLVLFFGGQS